LMFCCFDILIILTAFISVLLREDPCKFAKFQGHQIVTFPYLYAVILRYSIIFSS
jgi:hypothetical protein